MVSKSTTQPISSVVTAIAPKGFCCPTLTKAAVTPGLTDPFRAGRHECQLLFFSRRPDPPEGTQRIGTCHQHQEMRRGADDRSRYSKRAAAAFDRSVTAAYLFRMLSRPARPTVAAGFVWPCLPVSAPKPPSGEDWLHEVKHDGFRVIARKTGKRVKLYSRPGNDLTYRFPLIVEAMAKLRSRSCIIDGEAVACGEDGLSSFDRIRYRRYDSTVFMWAFDLIELDGDDLRLDPLEMRKAISL